MFNKKLEKRVEKLECVVASLEEKLENKVLYKFIIEEGASRDYLAGYANLPYAQFTGKNIYVDEVIGLILDKMKLDIKYEPEKAVVSPANFKLVKKK